MEELMAWEATANSRAMGAGIEWRVLKIWKAYLIFCLVSKTEPRSRGTACLSVKFSCCKMGANPFITSVLKFSMCIEFSVRNSCLARIQFITRNYSSDKSAFITSIFASCSLSQDELLVRSSIERIFWKDRSSLVRFGSVPCTGTEPDCLWELGLRDTTRYIRRALDDCYIVSLCHVHI